MASNKARETSTMLRELKAIKGPTTLDIGKVNHVCGQSSYTGRNLSLNNSEPREPGLL